SEPGRVRRAAEVRSIHDCDTGNVDCILRELEPDEVAALWPAPCRRGKLALERGEHGIAPGAEQRAHALEVGLEVAAAQELEHGGLSEQYRRDVRRDGERFELAVERLREDEVADAQARRNRLGEGRRIDHALA